CWLDDAILDNRHRPENAGGGTTGHESRSNVARTPAPVDRPPPTFRHYSLSTQLVGCSRRHTHILAQPAHLPASSSDWIHLGLKFDFRASCRGALMQRECVTNEAQEVRYRAVSCV